MLRASDEMRCKNIFVLGDKQKEEREMKKPGSWLPWRKVCCVLSWGYTLPTCSGPLLYEMPLAEIDKMLELIKTTIKTPQGIFLQTTARNIFSISSGLVSQSAFRSEQGSRQSMIRVNTVFVLVWFIVNSSSLCLSSVREKVTMNLKALTRKCYLKSNTGLW